MCRHLGYVGPPVSVGELVLRGPHSLFVQSWAPREMRAGGTINADGFGVAWWRWAEVGPGGARSAVTRYRNSAPIWTDPAVAEVLGQLESRSVLAAVRSATVGMPVERAACAPFIDEHWAFSHNGVVPDWRRTLLAVLAEVTSLLGAEASNVVGAGPTSRSGIDGAPTHGAPTHGAPTHGAPTGGAPSHGVLTDGAPGHGAPGALSGSVLLEAEALTDSAVLWVLLRALLAAIGPDGPVTSPADALRLLVTTVLRHQPAARLNLLLSDGDQLWATTCRHALSVLVADDYTVLSSEPYDDDPRWQPIADHQLVTATPGHCDITALELPATERVRS
ncbi:class II glutamine amidotransferase [Nocardia mangyaensis]|uniref:class II glutamine amidotransferase n=1 Tax=Nocardia mangyaensis TaxID=2213200 RepID=UPI000A9D8938|nr:class II glutamine amidotransferase [Nocardia mangyaensis]